MKYVGAILIAVVLALSAAAPAGADTAETAVQQVQQVANETVEYGSSEVLDLSAEAEGEASRVRREKVLVVCAIITTVVVLGQAACQAIGVG